MCVISAIVCLINFNEQAKFWDWVFYKLLVFFVFFFLFFFFFFFSKTYSTDFVVVLIRHSSKGSDEK